MTVADILALWGKQIEPAASRQRLEPALVAAIVLVESAGNPWAYNPEPRYRWFWDVREQRPFRPVTAEEIASERPPADFRATRGDPDQEWWAQQASWGLMQVMGAVARELGFTGPYLTQLCMPTLSIELGCELLARRVRWADGDLARAIAAYNGGPGCWREAGPQEYAARVLEHLGPWPR